MIISKKATKIDLSNLNLTEFPIELLNCKNLTKLNLSHNKIKVLPKEISELRYLKNLDISYNGISILYAKTFELYNLEVLIINNNKIKKIPDQIGHLKKLKKLSIAGNQLEVLPNIIHALPNLKSLDITNNKFKLFPNQIFTNKSLTHLWLGKNIFNEFPTCELIKNLPSLKYLYCYSATINSVNSIHNDYEILQQKKGNCISILKMIAKDQNNEHATRNLINKKKHIFISYSHKDKAYKKRVDVSLKGIQYLGFDLTFWSDTQMIGGEQWKETIMSELDKAGIVINIISADYMASDFIQKTELPALLKKAKDEGTLILNLIARRCAFAETVLAPYQAINDLDDPIEKNNKDGQDSIYLALTYRVINEFKK